MKYHLLYVMLLLQLSLSGQQLMGVDDIRLVDEPERLCYHLISGLEVVTLEVPRPLQEQDQVYMDQEFCLILLKNDSINNSVSAAFKSNDQWIQDYNNRAVWIPSSSATGSKILDVNIIDGETLSMHYLYYYKGTKDVQTKWSLGLHGFYDHYVNMSFNTHHVREALIDSNYVGACPDYFSKIGEVNEQRYVKNKK